MIKSYILAAAILLSVNFLLAQSKTTGFITDSLDLYVERALGEWQIPGVAILVVKDGEVIVSKGFGLLEIGKPDKVDENTLFMIASNTKAFTGTALAMLENEGKCSFDDKVQKYLPDFKMKDPWVAEHLTLTDVTSHRIGMETFQGDFMYWESDLSSEEVIEKFGMLDPMYDFRAKWGYCNAGFLVAGLCIEKISGLTWEQFIRQRLINPLEMNRTLVLTSETKNATNLASAHTMADGKLQVIPHCQVDNIAPAASISSSVNDMSHWVMALLDSGYYKGKEVIPYESIQQTRYPRSIIRKAGHPFNTAHYSLYGMGWDLMDYEGREIVSHTGGVDGFVTSVTLLPEENLGVVVLTNTDANAFYQAVKWEIIDSYLGLPYRDYSGVYKPRFQRGTDHELAMIKSWRDSVGMKPETPVKLSNFEGKYVNEVYGWAELKARDGYLELTLEHHPNLTGKLEYMGNNQFLCTYSHPMWGIKVFPFVIEDKKVKSFTLSVADFLEFTTYNFVKQ
jgi:CubicO group peptidase (beta-lactamase class C family)